MTGNEYRKLIGRYLVNNYTDRGLTVYEEVYLGTSIIGKQRRIDLLVIDSKGTALAVECKFQDSSGTVDEKIPYALNDMRAQRVPSALVYAGRGFSPGVLHLLQGSEEAAFCLPDEDSLERIPRRNGPLDIGTWQLDHLIAQNFNFWDIIVGEREPLRLDAPLTPKRRRSAPKPAKPLDADSTPDEGGEDHAPQNDAPTAQNDAALESLPSAGAAAAPPGNPALAQGSQPGLFQANATGGAQSQRAPASAKGLAEADQPE